MSQIDRLQQDWLITEPDFKLSDTEVFSTEPVRNTSKTGSNLSNIPLPFVEFRSPNMEVTNCHFHDLANIGWYSMGWGTFAGNLVDNIGWDAPDRGHGHFMYAQNRAPNEKMIVGNVFIKGFGDGFQMYGSYQSSIHNFMVINNIVLDSRWLVGGGRVEQVALWHNFLLGTLQLGYTSEPQGDIEVSDMFVIGNVKFNCPWQNVHFASNTVVGDLIVDKLFQAQGRWFEYNIYIGTKFKVGAKSLTFPEWQAFIGQEKTSQWYPTLQAAQEAGAILLPYDQFYSVGQGKHNGNVAIWNPLEQEVVPDPGFMGDIIYEVRQVRNYQLERRLYRADDVVYNMSGEVKPPNGELPQYHPQNLMPNLFPKLGVFELWEAC